MSKIGKKLIFSYLIIVTFTIIISMSIVKVSFERNLNERIIEGLEKDAQNISKQIEEDREIFRMFEHYDEGGSIYDIFPSVAAFNYSVRFASTNIIILNQNKNIMYTSLKEEISLIEFLTTEEAKSNYFKAESGIRNSKGEVIGYVLTLAKKEDTGSINAMINEAAVMGMVISGLIAMMLAVFFEKNITNPIKRLSRNIKNFKIEGPIQWESINTKDEISDLNENFKKLTSNLVKYDRQQKEFFQNSSHELKTPLMSIRSYAEAIKDGIASDNEVDKFLDIIIDESNKLAEIVNSIMYMTKLDENKDRSQIAEINLSEIVEEITTRFVAVASEQNIRIVYDIDPSIKLQMPEDHTFMIFSNLIANALRYAKEEIHIDARIEDKKLQIEVYDDGEGFHEDEITRVFDRFFKGEKGLSGLGLSIVKGIVESHNGRVIALNRKEGGACVQIIF